MTAKSHKFLQKELRTFPLNILFCILQSVKIPNGFDLPQLGTDIMGLEDFVILYNVSGLIVM